MAPTLYEAVFGVEMSKDIDQWKAVCSRHYSKLKNTDGIILGYHYRDGKVRAFIKDEAF